MGLARLRICRNRFFVSVYRRGNFATFGKHDSEQYVSVSELGIYGYGFFEQGSRPYQRRSVSGGSRVLLNRCGVVIVSEGVSRLLLCKPCQLLPSARKRIGRCFCHFAQKQVRRRIGRIEVRSIAEIARRI